MDQGYGDGHFERLRAKSPSFLGVVGREFAADTTQLAASEWTLCGGKGESTVVFCFVGIFAWLEFRFQNFWVRVHGIGGIQGA